MLNRCLRVGFEVGIRVNRLPRGYETSGHMMSWARDEKRNTDQHCGCMYALVSIHLDLVERRTDLGRQWHKQEV
jgi:hypothetical protein